MKQQQVQQGAQTNNFPFSSGDKEIPGLACGKYKEKVEMSKALIVIDYQGCFLPGGGLATNIDRPEQHSVTGDATGEITAKKIDTLIKSGKFSDVYFTKDMHHPDNISINNTKPFTTNTKTYEGRNMINPRRWVKEDDRLMQKKWPRHCVMPKENPFFDKLIVSKGIASKNNSPSNNLGANPLSAINTRVLATNLGDKFDRFGEAYGADMPFALAVYEKGKPEGVSANIYEVYKGFGYGVDSYSAVADALGEFTPFIAKKNGQFMSDDSMKFIDTLKAANFSDIYLTGIARDVCVYWTAMDILDYWILPALAAGESVPKLHFLYDLTRPVGQVPVAFNKNGVPTEWFVVDKSKDEILAGVSQLFSAAGMAGKESQYFMVEDSGSMGGGRRRNTRKSHKRGCSCCSKRKGGARKGTRKPMGHKKGCKCIICKRR